MNSGETTDGRFKGCPYPVGTCERQQWIAGLRTLIGIAERENEAAKRVSYTDCNQAGHKAWRQSFARKAKFLGKSIRLAPKRLSLWLAELRLC